MNAKNFTEYQQCNLILDRFVKQIEIPFKKELTAIINGCMDTNATNFTQQK